MTTTAGPQTALQLRNVLIATDFSSCSERALLHAVAAAHSFGSTLHLVYVVQPDAYYLVPPDGYMGIPTAVGMATDLARTSAETRLSEVLHRTGCDDLTYKLWLGHGDPAETICEVIEREHIDMAVVGTHARSGLRKLVAGSVAESVFRCAACPVLTVGPHSWRSDPQSLHLKHILFPTDLSRESAGALPFVMAVAARFSSALTLLSVVETLNAEAALDRARVVRGIEERMREMVSAIDPVRPDVSFRVEFGDVAETVIQTASFLTTDLVAFGLKPPYSYADRLPWKNAYKIVGEVECPVLSMRGGRRETP